MFNGSNSDRKSQLSGILRELRDIVIYDIYVIYVNSGILRDPLNLRDIVIYDIYVIYVIYVI